jgi:hypothetical protein
MKSLIAFFSLALASCQMVSHEAHNGTGKWEKDFAMTLGGTTHTTGADGWANSTDHNQSFQVGAQAATTIIGGIAAGQVSKAKTASDNATATAQQANTNATAVQQAQIQAQSAAAAAKAATASKAIDAGLFTPVPFPTKK